MPIYVPFRDELFGTWEAAKSKILDNFDTLAAQLGPLSPLITGLQASLGTVTSNPIVGLSYPASAVLSTNTSGSPSFTSVLPIGTAITGPITVVSTSPTVITPTTLAVNTNDWGPTNLASAAVIRVAASVAIDLTGIVAQTAGQFRLLINVGTFTITIKHASASSSAANRFIGTGAADVALTQASARWIWYDPTSTRWQII